MYLVDLEKYRKQKVNISEIYYVKEGITRGFYKNGERYYLALEDPFPFPLAREVERKSWEFEEVKQEVVEDHFAYKFNNDTFPSLIYNLRKGIENYLTGNYSIVEFYSKMFPGLDGFVKKEKELLKEAAKEGHNIPFIP